MHVQVFVYVCERMCVLIVKQETAGEGKEELCEKKEERESIRETEREVSDELRSSPVCFSWLDVAVT